MYNVFINSSGPFMNFGGLQWPPFSEKTDVFMYKMHFFSIFTSVLDKICIEDLKKVHCLGGSLEVKWSSNGGHNV